MLSIIAAGVFRITERSGTGVKGLTLRRIEVVNTCDCACCTITGHKKHRERRFGAQKAA